MDPTLNQYRNFQSHQQTILQLPLHLQSRLSPAILSLSLTSLFAFHSFITLIISYFQLHPSYSLPLSLTGLLISNLTNSFTDLLPIFTNLHFASIFLDILWLTFSTSPIVLQFKENDVIKEIQGERVSQLCVFLVGFNMIFKLFTLVNCSVKLKELGIIEDVQPFVLGNNTGGYGYGPFGGYNGNQNQDASVPGGYRPIYDEETIDSYQSHQPQRQPAQYQSQDQQQSQGQGGPGYGRAQAQHGRKNSEADAKILSSLDQRLMNPNSTSTSNQPAPTRSQNQEDQNSGSGNGYHSIE